MRILYGVQATGNGHITRARALNKHFTEFGIQADFLFSGRELDKFWDMEEFGSWQLKRGLTFVHEAGDLKMLKTIQQNRLGEFYRDVRELDLSPYDLIVTDFEPIVAWAAKQQKRTCVGVGHQYAFGHNVPQRGGSWHARTIMRMFAPVDISLGLHWHHFDTPILPPIAETPHTTEARDPNKVVVYLGFEEPEHVIQLLEPFEDTLFTYYGPFAQYESRGHIQLKPLSREGFQHDLATCGGVISNAGFELSSESIQLGNKLLVKPLKGQMEQLSNAEALQLLGLGTSMDTLDRDIVKTWLAQENGKRVIYPNVARTIVEWMSRGEWQDNNGLNQIIYALWEATRAVGVDSFIKNPLPKLQLGNALLNKA